MAGFVECTCCHQVWVDRDEFLGDPEVEVAGYQVDFRELRAGFFLFTHLASGCLSSFAVSVNRFLDFHDGPVFTDRLTGTDACEEHCLHRSDLRSCRQQCECAYVRDVLQTVRHWPKLADRESP